jgi:multiple sugar transport system permease protein
LATDQAGDVRPQARAPSRPSRRARREARWGYAFIAPNFLALAVFFLGPIIAALVISFTDWDLIGGAEFVGLDNYRRMADDPQLLVSLRNTTYFAVLTIPLTVFVSLVLALALDKAIRGVSLFRAAFFVPVVASVVAVGMVWRWVYNAQFGVLNHVLGLVGIPPQSWLTSERLVIPSLVIVAVWRSMGFNMVIFLAGLRAIPAHLYEAAAVDGAKYHQRVWHVTLPLLAPSIFFVSVMTVIASFQVFDLVFVMTGGGPGDASRVYYFHLWQNGFRFFRMGYASAMAWLLFAILFILTLAQMRFMGKRVQYEVG